MDDRWFSGEVPPPGRTRKFYLYGNPVYRPQPPSSRALRLTRNSTRILSRSSSMRVRAFACCLGKPQHKANLRRSAIAVVR